MCTCNNNAKFRILLQVDNGKDDILTIQPSSTSFVFDVNFKQETIGIVNKALLKPSGIITYVELFLNSVLLDQNGFTCIQIDCPPYPTVIINRDKIENYMPTLRIQLASIIENWPREECMN